MIQNQYYAVNGNVIYDVIHGERFHICHKCGKPFVIRRETAKYCCPAHRQAAWEAAISQNNMDIEYFLNWLNAVKYAPMRAIIQHISFYNESPKPLAFLARAGFIREIRHDDNLIGYSIAEYDMTEDELSEVWKREQNGGKYLPLDAWKWQAKHG